MEAVRAFVQRVRESLFFVPSLVVVASLLLARFCIYLDHDVESVADAPLLLSVSVTGGRAIAAAVAGATITVAAIVFSITALSTQVAASQYSPRAVAGFFEDRFQMLVIGLVVGTFGFSLSVLAGFGGGESIERASTRSVSATLALILGICSVLAILGYLDHSLRRLRIDVVVRRIADDTVASIRREHSSDRRPDSMEERAHPTGQSVPVTSRRTGWVRAIEAAAMAQAMPPDSLTRVEVRVGEAVSEGELIATVWGVEDSGRETIQGIFRRRVQLGRNRSIAGDPAYGLRQLVDIALRALSPGVNDPTTAIDVLQHIKLPLREILTTEAPARVFSGSANQRVLLTEAPSRSDYVHDAVGEIRLAAGRQPSVLITIIEVLSELIDELEVSDMESRTGALREEATLTIDQARSSGLPTEDLTRVLRGAGDLAPEDPAQGRAGGT